MTSKIRVLLKRAVGSLWFSRPPKCSCTALVLSWNRAELTLECVQSLLQNGPSDLQLIMVDNSSSVDQKEVLKKGLAPYGSQVTAVWLPRNFGGQAFNFVSWRARGEFVLFCENDLFFAPNWFEKMKIFFDRDPLLGQLSPLSAIPQFEKGEVWTTKPGHPETVEGVTYFRSFTNLGSTSLVPRRVLQQGVFWKNISSEDGKIHFPDDGGFSSQIRNLGFKLGWMETALAENVGHQPQEWERNKSYYLENWKLKSRLGIDSERTADTELDFNSQKLKYEKTSRKSYKIHLQRQHPDGLQLEELIPETGRVFFDQGSGFQMGQFQEFSFSIRGASDVSIIFSSENVRRVRIDPIDCPAEVLFENMEALSLDGKKISLKDSACRKLDIPLRLATFSENPQLVLTSEKPIRKIDFRISVKVNLNE